MFPKDVRSAVLRAGDAVQLLQCLPHINGLDPNTIQIRIQEALSLKHKQQDKYCILARASQTQLSATR